MVELVVALVGMVIHEATYVVEHQFSIVDQRQPARGSIAKELIADAAEDAGDYFRVIV